MTSAPSPVLILDGAALSAVLILAGAAGFQQF